MFTFRYSIHSCVWYCKDLERHAQSQASGTNAPSRATERTASAAGADTTVTVGNRQSSATMARIAPKPPFNPYAHSNRRKSTTSTATPDPTGTARTISPVVAASTTTAAETPKRSRKNTRSKNNNKNNGKRPHRAGGGGNGKQSPSVSSPAFRDIEQYPHHRSGQILRSSRHFGGGSFRPPDEFLMRLAATNSSSDNTNDNGNDNGNHFHIQNRNQHSNYYKQNGSTPSETTPASLRERKGQKRGASSIRYQIEDTNDDDDEEDDDDDNAWLDAAPIFSSSTNKMNRLG